MFRFYFSTDISFANNRISSTGLRRAAPETATTEFSFDFRLVLPVCFLQDMSGQKADTIILLCKNIWAHIRKQSWNGILKNSLLMDAPLMNP